MKSVNASSGYGVGGVVLDPDQRDFLGEIEGLQMTAVSRKYSHTDLNRIDETRGNISVEGGCLLVNEKNIDTLITISVFGAAALKKNTSVRGTDLGI